MESERPYTPETPGREPMFNAPVLALLLAGSILGLFYLQAGRPDEMSLVFRYGLIPARLEDGAYVGVLTHMLLHGGWMHAVMNATGALAFGSPVARILNGPAGVAGFLAFYVICGVAAGLGYALLYIESTAPMIGASGAVFGLIGGATRLLGGGGAVLPLTDRRVVSASLAWIGVNVFIGVSGFAPGAEGARIAWEAHVIGLVAGLLLIGPWVRWFARPAPPADEPFDSAPHMSDPEHRSGPWGP